MRELVHRVEEWSAVEHDERHADRECERKRNAEVQDSGVEPRVVGDGSGASHTCSRWLTSIGTTRITALYFVAAASPATRPAAANRPRRRVRCASISSATAATIKPVITTSVVPKCEPRTCMNANVKKSADTIAGGVVANLPTQSEDDEHAHRARDARRSLAGSEKTVPSAPASWRACRSSSETRRSRRPRGNTRRTRSPRSRGTARGSRRSAADVRRAASERDR